MDASPTCFPARLAGARLAQVAALDHVLDAATAVLLTRRGKEAAILRLRVAAARGEMRELRRALRLAAAGAAEIVSGTD